MKDYKKLLYIAVATGIVILSIVLIGLLIPKNKITAVTSKKNEFTLNIKGQKENNATLTIKNDKSTNQEFDVVLRNPKLSSNKDIIYIIKEKKDKVIVIEHLANNWTKIRTKNGIIGYVKTNILQNEIYLRDFLYLIF